MMNFNKEAGTVPAVSALDCNEPTLRLRVARKARHRSMTNLRRACEPNMGFDPCMDPATARRQLHLSVGVVVILALAIVTAALNLQTRPVSASSYMVSIPTAAHEAANALPAHRS